MRRLVMPLLTLLWFGAACVGMQRMMRYEIKPGAPANAPDSWPGAAGVRRDRDRPTLILFAHPRCPCTRATLSELEETMARAHGRTLTIVLFYRPSGEPAGWERTDLWRKAAGIPGVEVMVDPDAAAARAFGASISGQALLYDKNGQLVFRGGITAARGHVGDNTGRRALLALIAGEQTRSTEAPVFGCSLFAPSRTVIGSGKAGGLNEAPPVNK